MIPIISIVGKSDSGKTNFLEVIIPKLKEKGLRVGTIKHDVHGFDIDKPGKDTWRHKQAGADLVLISSPYKISLIKDVDKDSELDELREKYIDDVDLILTEGYKSGDKAKIEIFRPAKHGEKLCDPKVDDILTTVINEEKDDSEEYFSESEVERVAEVIIDYYNNFKK
ncbi:molybdopterin-guanine dinucleotide biosynthesis protein B [Halanaerobiaceae bacterium Z-7014]|uniref:Molybdopterin-guanine dinucleotide biosynthesis protein B n=1 Tax=Halonatronomonas betaini TaxID=2778430 RepID=A0A931ATY4_9FIRM|nr:molybdopterin-guanine dinucleotide biosynthesis protein B [Halonatronomonas betaini]MBF8436415.1 molybdopterin-guanine dinucleotide biosynthesis protein B [Halonatronomonas betaini]